MKIHVLTLSWNGKDKLKNLRNGLCTNLTHITHQNGELKNGFDHSEWHVRDNGSKDGTVDELNSWGGKSDFPISPIVYDIGHNRDSFAKCVNYLFEQATPSDDDLILLLNNDVEFSSHDSLSNMFDLMRNTNAAVVGARLLYKNTDKLQHAGVIFGKRYGYLPYHYRHQEKSDANAEKNRYFQAVTAAVCFVKASSFRRIGGMDESLRWAFDDVDICLSIGQTEKIAYCGNTRIFHEESGTLKTNPVNKMFMQHNVKHFKQKWEGKYKIDHELYLNNPNYNIID